MKRAALFVGGWEGHTPQAFCDWAVELLEGEAFTVTTYDTLAPLAEPGELGDVDLIVPIWSSARSSHQEEFGNMNKAEEDGLLHLIANGCGIAGWHGHMGDAFRDHPTYHFLIGGQFVGHPPGWPDNPVPSEDFIEYDVTITKPDDPIVQGIKSFRLKSEQYYMLATRRTMCWPQPRSPGSTCGGSRGPGSRWCGSDGGIRVGFFIVRSGTRSTISSYPRSPRSCDAECAGQPRPTNALKSAPSRD